jgi:NAD(P)H-quinone oxidoreductase subunit 5
MSALPDTAVTTMPAWQALLLLGPALAYAAAAMAARSSPSAAGRVTDAAAWRVAHGAAGLAAVCAAASLAAVLAGLDRVFPAIRADVLGGVVLLLVACVGWAIVRYSQPLLGGEPAQAGYVRWLMATLCAVSLVAVANHLLLLVAAWSASSLALHHLLTFFQGRQAALVAAHKKFIVARGADACMLLAAWLLYSAFGTLHIDALMAQAASPGPLPATAQAAVLLVAAAALLKCAQLPFHGWLIQVMEAPTPVSALLHAGLVNLGGFVLVRFAPLLAEVPAAQVLLVVWGAATAVLAALVMTTRISVKVMLAWSTCAQMGFMVMQCGLGLWHLALLHLVAHSLYKAHAFLGAGGAVRRTALAKLTPQAEAPRAGALAVGVLLGLGLSVAAAVLLAQLVPAAQHGSLVMAGILGLALVPLVHAQALRLGGWWALALPLGGFAAALAYGALVAVAGALVPSGSVATPMALWWLVAGAFGALFVLQTLVAVAPRSALARRLYPWFYGGLFLDEAFSRVAFSVWPPPRAPASAVVHAAPGALQGTPAATMLPTATAGARP